MNLNESFRYLNFLDDMFQKASRSILNEEHCLKTYKHHMIKKVVPEENDINEEVEVEEYPSNDSVLLFIKVLIEEKEGISQAIFKAKNSLDFDLDSAIATNKFRQMASKNIGSMLRYKPSKSKEFGRGYKFNVEGNQSPYTYEIEVEREYAYDVGNAKNLMKQYSTKADETSLLIEQAMVNTTVQFNPKFNVNDSFDDIMEEFNS